MSESAACARALLDLFRDTVRFFWRYPDRMLAAVFQHYFGEPEKAKRIIEEMREADRVREQERPELQKKTPLGRGR